MSWDGLARKTAVIGVGAQKAGTSWLYGCLAGSPEVAASSITEQHYLDAWLHPERFGEFHRWFVRRLKSEMDRDVDAVTTRALGRDLVDRVRAIHHPDGYLDHFARLMGPGKLAFLDVTPSYALLSADSLSTMKRFLERAGVCVKIVFVMRDPIRRHHSALRMAARDQAAAGRRFVAAENFEACLDDPAYRDRGRYDWTVRNLERVFRRDQIFYGFYETLFERRALRRLTDFIGLSPVEADFSRRRNVSPPDGDLTAGQVDAARRAFQPVYAFCRQRFADEVPSSWHA